MAGVSPTSGSKASFNSGNQNYGIALVLLLVLYFIIGFSTVLNDVLIPSMKELFHLETWQALLIQFAFFGAYFVWSVPAGAIIQRIGYRKGLALSLGIIAVGLLLFVPAASIVKYGFFLFALFVLATGLTFMQVALNPLIVAVGPARTGSSRMNLGGTFNSTATTLGPIIGGAFILQAIHRDGFVDQTAYMAAKAHAVQGPYIVTAVVVAAIAVALFFIKLPSMHTPEDDDGEVDPIEAKSAYEFEHLLYGAGAIFFYVGVEVALGSVLILYLQTTEMGALVDRHAASLLAYYWGSAMIGRLAGSILCRYVAPQKLLRGVTVAALALVLFSMSSYAINHWVDIAIVLINSDNGLSINSTLVHVPFAAYCLILCGLCHSVMWPLIFPLSISKLGRHTAQGSGLLCMMIVGGAIIPFTQGLLEKGIGFRYSFLICAVCYVYILFFAIKGYRAGKISALKQQPETDAPIMASQAEQA